ncbi:MAG TPA: Crp/Fnr family transcriptional regulator [Terriglobales bacterium]|nr:Crp/Fnr family transcriptional regulator [Terriglobales bacterium]
MERRETTIDGLFLGELPSRARSEFESISCTINYPDGAAIFAEGQSPRGVFIVRRGQVKLSICSSEGKTLILRLAEPGEVLGLAGTLSSRPYEMTAEAVGPCEVEYVKRDGFLRFMQSHNEVCLWVAEQLSHMYNTACHEIRSLGLSHSAAEKLAKLLLDWSGHNGDTRQNARIKLSLTHEEVAQMIGTSRETVTRLFADFRKRQFIQLNGSTLLIRNKASLEAMAHS